MAKSRQSQPTRGRQLFIFEIYLGGDDVTGEPWTVSTATDGNGTEGVDKGGEDITIDSQFYKFNPIGQSIGPIKSGERYPIRNRRAYYAFNQSA